MSPYLVNTILAIIGVVIGHWWGGIVGRRAVARQRWDHIDVLNSLQQTHEAQLKRMIENAVADAEAQCEQKRVDLIASNDNLRSQIQTYQTDIAKLSTKVTQIIDSVLAPDRAGDGKLW